MSQPNLNEDLNIVANSNLEITLLDGDLNIIQALDDEPNDVGGLTSAELKAKFDEGPNKIKTYINETLIPEILTEEATEAARAAAEAQRETNENQRVENENARIAAEEARTSSETARDTAEQARDAAEQARAAAELSRAEAEQARADENTGIVAQATEQAVIATNAASEASNSASSAVTSASAASASASSASDSASASASSATAAQASADEALSSKNSAKSEADRAKSEADRAAEIVGGDFVKSSEKGAANGVATLGADALLAAAQRPKAGGLYRDDGTTTLEASLAEISTTLQNKADLGTVYSKPETLSDTTKTLFGLDATAVPDDALALLSRFHKELGNEYLWKKSKTEEFEDIVELTNVEIWRGESGQNNTFYVGTGFKNNSGSETYPYRVTGLTNFSAYSQSADSVTSNFLGKYISANDVLNVNGYSTKEKGVYYIPTDATVTHTEISSTGTRVYSLTVSKVIATRNHRFVTTEYGYVNSPDSNAYPPAVSDGYTYTALGELGAKAQIATGNYTGTGTYGASNPNSLTFDFEPKFLYIGAIVSSEFQGILLPNLGSGRMWQQNYDENLNVSLSGNTAKWYSTANTKNQLNANGTTYNYIAIG